MYLSLDEFEELGGATGIEDEIFARLEAKARAQLDRLTFGRLKHETDVRENVKYCMVDLVNAIHADESAGAIATGREIASMSNDGVSISFSAGSASGGSRGISARYAGIVRSWMLNETDAHGLPLMYPGVYVK